MSWVKPSVGAVVFGVGVACVSPVFAADMGVTPMPVKAVAQAPDKSWTYIFDTDTRYSTWERTSGNSPGVPNQKGSQVYTPLSAQLIGKPVDALKLEFLVRGGYVSTSRSALPGDQGILGVPFSTGRVATTTDTILTGTATYLGWDGLQPFYSLNLNAPTGKTVLLGLSGIARTDPDLVEVPTFGEGFNTGNTLGVNIPFTTDIMLTLSGNYTKKGGYDREVADPATLMGVNLPLDHVRPGDAKSLSANLAAAFGRFSFNVSGMATYNLADQLNGMEVFRNGRVFYVSGTAAYKWDEMWTSTLTTSYTNTQRLLIADPLTGLLFSEPFNSNSNLVRTSFIQALAWRSFVFNGTVGYMHRYQNEYDPLAQAFVPAKTKWSAGGGVKYAATSNVSLSARAEHFWINESVKPTDPAFAAVVNGLPMKYEGWLLVAGGTLTF